MGTDGRGVTTLVAFMGCPLRCKYCLNDWCHRSMDGTDAYSRRAGARMWSPHELHEALKQDDLYFQVTGGGVCFGGGEPALRADFIREFAALCGKRWRITIETSLAVPYAEIQKLVPVVDQWIVDVKDLNADIYKAYTGQISHILAQLTRLKRVVPQKRIALRVPRIPGFNSKDDVEKSYCKLKNMGFDHVQIFSYIIPHKPR